jgi:hypothetical protein
MRSSKVMGGRAFSCLAAIHCRKCSVSTSSHKHEAKSCVYHDAQEWSDDVKVLLQRHLVCRALTLKVELVVFLL